MRNRIIRLSAASLILVLGGVACSTSKTNAATDTKAPVATATSKAATLRATLDTLLEKHVAFACSATGAALGGRTTEFDAAAGVLLGKNTDDLTAAIQSVYGDGAAEQFKALWKKHIGFVVDYTSSYSDKAKHDKAVADLLQYTQDFGAFLGGATGLPTDAVASLVKEHILSLKAVVDAQHDKNLADSYGRLDVAIGHMDAIGSALADAIAKQKGF